MPHSPAGEPDFSKPNLLHIRPTDAVAFSGGGPVARVCGRTKELASRDRHVGGRPRSVYSLTEWLCPLTPDKAWGCLGYWDDGHRLFYLASECEPITRIGPKNPSELLEIQARRFGARDAM